MWSSTFLPGRRPWPPSPRGSVSENLHSCIPLRVTRLSTTTNPECAGPWIGMLGCTDNNINATRKTRVGLPSNCRKLHLRRKLGSHSITDSRACIHWLVLSFKKMFTSIKKGGRIYFEVLSKLILIWSFAKQSHLQEDHARIVGVEI